jgi:hypothetical protein
VTVLNPSGSGLLFSSYFGGGGTDYGYGIALDSAGNAYVGGQTDSSNFPTTAGTYQRTAGGGFALKIDPPADTSEVSVPIAGLTGSSATSSASGVIATNANAAVTQAAFYPNDALAGFGTQTVPGLWNSAIAVNVTPGDHATDAQAEDSFGVFGDAAWGPLVL